jgi:HD-GYP domain-containing protein (c-di-GMP phosphodiesterase class II)
MRGAQITLSDEQLMERNDVVRSFLTRLDKHSPSEQGHAERVAVYAVATAEAMGFDDDFLLNIRYAALLHDVGKISLDANLLAKMGKLTEEELDALRLHSMIAAGLLEAIDWLEPCLPDIRHHHERWDGEGYPDGLVGSDIPVGARIINLAETFDVILTGLQGDPRSEKAALDEIKRCSGSQFDPRVVDAFVSVQPLIQPLSI